MTIWSTSKEKRSLQQAAAVATAAAAAAQLAEQAPRIAEANEGWTALADAAVQHAASD